MEKMRIIAGSGHGTLKPWLALLPPFHYECLITTSSVGAMVTLDDTLMYNSNKNIRIMHALFS